MTIDTKQTLHSKDITNNDMNIEQALSFIFNDKSKKTTTKKEIKSKSRINKNTTVKARTQHNVSTNPGKNNKDKIKNMYLQGYTAVQISKSLGKTYESVKKYIQRNFKDLKSRHDIAVIQRKDALKASEYEAKRYMSDREFIDKNRSVYTTLRNGDIVINKEASGDITFDTPRRLVNENKQR